MKLARDPVGTAEARAMLDQLPGLYFAVLKTAQIEQIETGVHCSFELPLIGKRTKSAATVADAILALLIELSEVLTKTPIQEWPDAWRELATATPSMAPSKQTNGERFQSKTRQFTVGVTMPIKLKAFLQASATKQRTSFAEATRQLTSIGFENFDERSFSEGSEQLFSAFSVELAKWQPAKSEQVMIRLDPGLAVRLRASAKQYGRSASEFGAMCLAHGLVLQAALAEVERKVQAVQGPAIRRFEPKVGLGTPVELLSGVLAGTINPARQVLRRLGEVFDVPAFAVAAFFKRSGDSHAVPAFKAQNGKPEVFRSAVPWEDAVKSLKLPPERTRELLRLDE
jgi:hypothetical protein